MACGKVSATTRPPRWAAISEARSCRWCPSGFAAETPSRFQFSGRSAATDMSVSSAMSSSVKPDKQPAMIASSVVPGWSRTPAASATSSSRDALRDGTGWPAPSLWVGDCEVDSPSAPAASASCSSATIFSICSGGGLAADGVAAHRGQPKRRMANQETGIDRDAAVEAVEPVAERRPSPVETGPQRVQRHPLDPREHPGEVVVLVGCRGRQREAAVAAEDRGDAVLHRRARGRVPEQLRVVVGVQVDEARRQRLPLRVNGFRGWLIDVADRDDPSVADADVAVTGGCAGAVDDLGVADQQVEHAKPPSRLAASHPSSGSGWRNSCAALRWVIRAASSADRPATLRATTCWVSGQVESACG